MFIVIAVHNSNKKNIRFRVSMSFSSEYGLSDSGDLITFAGQMQAEGVCGERPDRRSQISQREKSQDAGGLPTALPNIHLGAYLLENKCIAK